MNKADKQPETKALQSAEDSQNRKATERFGN